MEPEIFLNKYLIAVGIPVILLLSGAFAKKLVRGSTWESRDFFLGVEFALAAMSSALIYFFDLARELNTHTGSPETVMKKMTATAIFVCLTFFVFLGILATHQDWENKTGQAGQLLRLGILSNVSGSGLLCGFILLVKGV